MERRLERPRSAAWLGSQSGRRPQSGKRRERDRTGSDLGFLTSTSRQLLLPPAAPVNNPDKIVRVHHHRKLQVAINLATAPPVYETDAVAKAPHKSPGDKLNANFVPDLYTKQRKLRSARLAKRRRQHRERFGMSRTRTPPLDPNANVTLLDQYNRMVDTLREQSLRLNGLRPKKPDPPPLPKKVSLPPMKKSFHRPRLDSKDEDIMDAEIRQMMASGREHISNPEHWERRGYVTTPSPVSWGATDLNIFPEEEAHFQEDVSSNSYFKPEARDHFFHTYKTMVKQELVGDAAASARLEYIRRCETNHVSPLPLLNFNKPSSLGSTMGSTLGSTFASTTGGGEGDAAGTTAEMEEARESQVLNFSDKLGGPTRLKTLIPFITSPPFPVHSLLLRNNNLTEQAGSELLIALQESDFMRKHLTVLDLSENRLGPRCCAKLSRGIAGNVFLQLVALDLSDNRLQHSGLMALLAAMAANKTVEQLMLREVGLELEGAAVRHLLCENRSLLELDLSWNNLSKTQALLVTEGLAENSSLTSVNLAHNNLGAGVACEALAATLSMQGGVASAITRLDLSYNTVGERACCMLMDTLAKNQKLSWLKLDGNPLGGLGCRALVKLFSTKMERREKKEEAGNKLRVSLVNCNFTLGTGFQTNANKKEEEKAKDKKDEKAGAGAGAAPPTPGKPAEEEEIHSFLSPDTVFDERFMNGSYKLDLSHPYEHYVAEQLWVQAVRDRGENFKDEKLDGKPFQLDEEADVDDIMNGELPLEGVLTLKYNSEKSDIELPKISSKLSRRIQNAFFVQSYETCCAVLGQHRSKSLAARKPQLRNSSQIHREASAGKADVNVKAHECIIAALSGLFSFDASHAKQMVDSLVSDSSAKVQAASKLFVSTGDASVLNALSPLQRFQVQNSLGQYWAFNPKNPTGHYSLNLATTIDRQLASRIFEVNSKERQKSADKGKLDRSQKKNRECIRNETLDGEAFTYVTGWAIPQKGRLEFDYISNDRAPADAEPISEQDFAAFLKRYICFTRGGGDIDDDELAAAREIFNKFDADGGGAVDSNEIEGILASLGFKIAKDMQRRNSHRRNSIGDAGRFVGEWEYSITRAQVAELVAEADNDKSGEVEWNEFLTIWQKLQRKKMVADTKAMFLQFDKDGGGSIDTEEVRSVLASIGLFPTKKDLARMVAQADEDGTGEIEFTEFLGLWEEVAWQHKYNNMLTELRRASTSHYFTAEQVRRIMDQMEEGKKDDAFVIFYSRIVDEEKYYIALEPLTVEERVSVQHSLGPLSIFNPLAPDGFYSLNLAQNDCHILARMLTDLADVERGRNWYGETYKGVPFGFNTLWIERTPTDGVLELRYSCSRGNEDLAYRKHMCEEKLGWEFDDDFDSETALAAARENASKKRREAKNADLQKQEERRKSTARRGSTNTQASKGWRGSISAATIAAGAAVRRQSQRKTPSSLDM